MPPRAAATLESALASWAEQLSVMAANEPESPAWQHGGIRVAVGLLGAGVTAAKSAAKTLCHLSTVGGAMDDFVREAGGIAPLVALLGAGADSEAARYAAGAL